MSLAFNYLVSAAGFVVLGLAWAIVGAKGPGPEDRKKLDEFRSKPTSSNFNPVTRDKHEVMREIIRRAAESKDPVFGKELKEIAEQVKKETKKSK